jgi:hypothetical protein
MNRRARAKYGDRKASLAAIAHEGGWMLCGRDEAGTIGASARQMGFRVSIKKVPGVASSMMVSYVGPLVPAAAGSSS